MAEAAPPVLDDPSIASDTVPPISAAIDFGTSSSGFAFKFDDSTNDVEVNKWVEGLSDKEKTPTTVLLREDKSFHSFGFEAEDEYADLCQNQQQKGWRYFHHFKMALYRNEKITKDMQIHDTENKPMAALDVLSIVLRYLKDKILEKVRQQRMPIDDDDVKYVITVPAIWSDAAKQMMRLAATHPSVGIRDDRLKLVLEPEAVSVYCALRPTERRQGASGGPSFQPLPEGSKYIIVDIGGGTLDVATHEIVSDGRIHESYVARGGDKGGHYFNEKCLDVFEALFGKECFNKWKSTGCEEYLELQRSIEKHKRKVGATQKDLNLEIYQSLLDLFEETSGGENIESFPAKCSKAVKSCSIKTGCIVLKGEFFTHILEEIAVEIENYIEPVLKELPSIKHVFIVGGLANSAFIRRHVEARFPKCMILVPEDPSVAVLKGAVSLGNRPQIIAGRIARFSYGVAITQEFIARKHKREYKIVRDGNVLCRNVFKKLIDKGEVLKYGQIFTKRTSVYATQPETKKKTFETCLYQSTKSSPMYVTDDGCCKLGGIREPPPEGGWPNSCGSTIEIIVGEAEFKLIVSDDTGRKYEAAIDFLLDD